MRVTSLQLTNFRSFESMGLIKFSQINVLVGPNNAGKSSILKALHLIQDGGGNIYQDVRVNAKQALVHIGLKDMKGELSFNGTGLLKITVTPTDRNTGNITLEMFVDGGDAPAKQLPNVDPHHFVVPYLSKRKTTYYQEDVKSENVNRVSADMANLAAKLSRLQLPDSLIMKVIGRRARQFSDLWWRPFTLKMGNVQEFICLIGSLFILIKWVKVSPILLGC